MKKLQDVNLKQNPVRSHPDYLKLIKETCLSLETLDDEPLSASVSVQPKIQLPIEVSSIITRFAKLGLKDITDNC